jgi:hypothetical protein
MQREEAFLALEQIEKDLETSIFSCMSPFNPMILGSSYEYEKMWETDVDNLGKAISEFYKNTTYFGD